MRMRPVLVLFTVLCFCLPNPVVQGQAQPSPVEMRKILRRNTPVYPEVAKRMNLSGTVKVVATVAPDGTVKAVQPVGGSPLLIQAAQSAIYNWKYAPASAESKESIELHFDPH